MLQVKNISFAYKNEPVIRDLSFAVRQGGHLSVIGESGSGKSTLLKLLYGKYDLGEGAIRWKDQPVLGPKYNLITGPDFMKYVAQEFNIMPYTSVADNVGEFLSNLYPVKKKKRIEELLKVVGLEGESQTLVKQLSGGQKQRVALAKALAVEPEVILLDEPFSHIDNFKKHGLRRSLFNYLKEKNITCIVATHDKDDVLGYADTILVLDAGSALSIEKPEKLYKDPKHGLVASFFEEFSVLKRSDLYHTANNSEVIVYAHELKPVVKSGLEVQVVKNYFKGDYFLVEGLFKDKTVFFKSRKQIQVHTVTGLKASVSVLEKRSDFIG